MKLKKHVRSPCTIVSHKYTTTIILPSCTYIGVYVGPKLGSLIMYLVAETCKCFIIIFVVIINKIKKDYCEALFIQCHVTSSTCLQDWNCVWILCSNDNFFHWQYRFAVIVMGKVEYIGEEDPNFPVNISVFKPHTVQGTFILVIQYTYFIIYIFWTLWIQLSRLFLIMLYEDIEWNVDWAWIWTEIFRAELGPFTLL